MRRSMYLWTIGVAAALDLPRGGVTAMRGASNVIRKLGGASNSDSARHGDFFDRSEALLRTENELEELDGGQPRTVED